ncbi:MAG: AAA family ATPase [Acidobacteria bacterium]|nr:AAA family ATPase [Acidobacteriota bacterium]
MRILRIRLQSFRGVDDATIKFAHDGVTIVEGPNEIGKTSSVIGLDLLFTEYDSSTKQAVKACQPVNHDAGPQVEVELEAGEYHVIFVKRWLKRPETTLKILKPTPSSLNGRPAHDKMIDILRGDIDLDLWRGLRYKQGEAISQATVGQNPSLQAALDAASGRVEDVQGAEVELWTRVEQERQRYVTPATGRPVADRARLAEEVAEQESEVAALKDTITELEKAAEELRGLREKVTKLELDLARDRQTLTEWQDKRRMLENAQRRVEVLEAEVNSAQSRQTLVEGDSEERGRMTTAVETLQHDLDQLNQQILREAPRLDQAAEEERAARESKDALRERLVTLRRRATLASVRADHFRKVTRVAFLGPRVTRVQEAVAQQLAAEEFLAGCSLTEELFERISLANESVIEQRARLAAEFPPASLRALNDIEVQVNGEDRTLSAEESIELPLGRELRVVLPNIAELVLNAGTSIEERQDALATAQVALDGLLAEAGVAGSDPVQSARALRGERQRHEHLLERVGAALSSDLEGRTPELLEAELNRLNEEIAAFDTAQPAGDDAPESLEEATALRDEVNRQVEELAQQETGVIRRYELASSAKQDLDVERARISERQRQSAAALDAANAALVTARATRPDSELMNARDDAATEVTTARAALGLERDALNNLDPDTIIEMLANAQGVVTRTENSLEATREQVRDRVSLLKVKGESGLHEQHDAALATSESLHRRQNQIDRQARVAQRLHEVLSRHRESARSAHVAPLKTEVERLGRMVFGPSFAVEIDRELLTIKSRTVNGVTVPFDSLSGGAKEQMSMIARLACALMVAGTGKGGASGVPIIIDDALGNSDPERLATLGAVIAAAGRLTQVIVLTCTPERFSNIGSAKVSSLALARQKSED